MTVQYHELGASLYMPATMSRLGEVLDTNKANARSVIICTEDAVAEDQVALAIRNLLSALEGLRARSAPRLFARPRSPFVLRQLLDSPVFYSRIDGVVIPKYDASTASRWASTLALKPDLPIMPTFETPTLFQDAPLLDTIGALKATPNPVIAIRVGANDLLGSIGLKRQPGQTVYDTPLRGVIERFITIARPAGYELSAPVCDLISEPETLAREVAIDMDWGFYAKSCIHPTQISLVESHYRESLERQAGHVAALTERPDAVFRHEGQMLEATCHHAWAHRTQRMINAQLKPQEG